jgi:hypothetical protein
MSNSLAIAAVTATLSRLLGDSLKDDLGGGSVTTRPLDKARDNSNNNQLNLFLYNVAIDGAWRNMDMPRQSRPGESGFPPLALNLFYLLTAYGKDDDKPDPNSHRLLGAAMSALHDHPLLGAAEIKAALSGNDLGDQIERVRITPQQLSLEEMSKLWAIFQAQYRISVAYQVSVVLIESRREARAALPVLQRGKDDRGITSQPDVLAPFPTLTGLAIPQGRPAALLGDTLVFAGYRLDGASVLVRFGSRRLAAPIDQPAAGNAAHVSVALPNKPAEWPAGPYTAAVVVRRAGEPDRLTNTLAFSLAPKITSTLPIEVKRDSKGRATIELTCSPEVRPEQEVALLVGDRSVAAQPFNNQTNKLKFVVGDAALGEFFVRLRVDGSDSLLVTDYQATPPVFDGTQKVKITP